MLLCARDSAVLLIDAQERLAPAVAERDQVVGNIVRLLQAARRLEVPLLASEQYRKGLGETLPELSAWVEAADRLEKLSFSCLGEPAYRARLAALGRRQLVLAGMETHVCVLQTALDLRREGHEVYVVADACGSRSAANKQAGLDRMARAGVEVVTTEMVVFEWLERAGSEAFREIAKLIK
jgi:nicotinamidase-related amidase